MLNAIISVVINMNEEITLLTNEQVFGENKLDVIKRTNNICKPTDFAVALGCSYFYEKNTIFDNLSNYYLSTPGENGNVQIAGYHTNCFVNAGDRSVGIRPVISFANLSDKLPFEIISHNYEELLRGYYRYETFYLEYPQVIDRGLQIALDYKYSQGTLKKTGKIWTIDSFVWTNDRDSFMPNEYEEYEFYGRRYIRVMYKNENRTLGFNGRYYWVMVSPIRWYVDMAAKLLISKYVLASGIRFCDNGMYNGDFKNSEMYTFLNDYFAKDIYDNQKRDININSEDAEMVKILKKIRAHKP